MNVDNQNTKEQTPSDWKIFLYYMRYLTPIWDKVLLVLLLAVILTILDINTILLPLLMRKFIDQVLAHQDWYMFKVLIIVIVCQIGLYLSFYTLSELVKYVFSIRLGISLGMDVFKHILRLPLSFFQKRPVGEHMYRVGTVFDPGFANLAVIGFLFETTGSVKAAQQPLVGNDVDAVLGMITQALDLIVRVTVRLLLILFTIAVGFNREVGIALVIFCIPYIWATHYLYNFQRRIEARFRGRSQIFYGGLQSWFAGVKTVLAFGKGRSEFMKNMGLYVKLLRVEWQNYFMKLVTDDFIFFFRYLFTAVALFYVCITQQPTAGVVFGLYLLLEQFFGPINMYIRVIEGIRIQLIPARRLTETLSFQSVITEKADAVSMERFAGPYHVNDVSFGYIPDQKVLTQVSLKISKGRRIGIVGPSGSGKTTMVNLLMRFYDPDTGEILADKVNLKDLKLGSYYEHIGIILQEDFLFGGNVRENIRFGKPNASDQEVIEAAKMAAVHDDIMQLPEAYDTDLGENTKLSGGQKQRIAIARALIRQPSVLILDEATSALDSQTAAVIDATLERVSKERTVVMITHKLASVRHFDEIFLIDRGRIREQGSFESLMARGGLFARLYGQQRKV